MDLNELLHAHQVEVMKAGASGGDRDRDGHFDKVALYAERIRQLRHGLQPATASTVPALQETIIYGSYAGNSKDDPVADPGEASFAAWESEGGSLDTPEIPVSADIAATSVRQYHVGSFVYQDMALALAEHKRQAARLLPAAE